MTIAQAIYSCNVCGWEYNPAEGDDIGGIAVGVALEDLPDGWECPVCGVGKEEFEDTGRVADVTAAPVATDALNSARYSVTIVGAGLAGYNVARELRKLAPQMDITVVTKDTGEVYLKPQLSTALAKGQEADALVQKTADDFANDLNIKILTFTEVEAIDTQNKKLVTSSRGALSYDKLVLAMGANPRIFPAKGSDDVDIATVNDIGDYRVWRHKIGKKSRVLLIGAGLIGSEFANDLAAGGYEVSVVDPAPWPIARFLPEQAGRALEKAIADKGARFFFGRTVDAYEKDGETKTALLSDGTRIDFDFALSAVGLVPRVELAKQAGLKTEQGILVDEYLATSDSNIFALGDCVQTGAGVLPFIAPLLESAKCLASTLCGKPKALELPAMPVVVKTPALATVVSPPRVGETGAWTVLNHENDNVRAVYVTTDGHKLGFALTGTETAAQNELAKEMPALLGSLNKIEESTMPANNSEIYDCPLCSYSYNPAEGDDVGEIAAGIAFADLPEDWICPICGAGKDEFEPAS